MPVERQYPRMSETSQQVRALYEALPYPERMPDGASDPYLDLMRSRSAVPPQGPQSFLDAGCGTGLNLLGAAMLYPHYQVYGLDLNRVALAEIRSDLERHQLTHAQVQALDLADLPDDFGPEGGFDVIYCTGVLHHLPEPETVLKRLTQRLAPQGVLRLMVYSQRGRADLYRFAQAVQELWPSSAWPLAKRLELARGLMGELERLHATAGDTPPPLRGTWADACHVGPAEFADRYLHPHDRPFTPAGLRQLLEGAGLRFLDWFEPRDWDLDALLPELAHSPDGPRDFWDRIELLDRLLERPKFDLYAVGPDFRPRRAAIDPDTLLSTNPQLFFEQVTVRGVPLAQAARLRQGPIEPLNRQQGRLLEALARRFASLRTLAQEQSWELDASWLEEAQQLVARGLLYTPHPLPIS